MERQADRMQEKRGSVHGGKHLNHAWARGYPAILMQFDFDQDK